MVVFNLLLYTCTCIKIKSLMCCDGRLYDRRVKFFILSPILFRSEKHLGQFNNKHDSLCDFNCWLFPFHNNPRNSNVFPIHVRFSYKY